LRLLDLAVAINRSVLDGKERAVFNFSGKTGACFNLEFVRVRLGNWELEGELTAD
jgi:hypothetical protein